MSDPRPTGGRAVAIALVATAAFVAAVALVAGLVRTTVPLTIEGRVDEVVHHNRDKGGTDYWELRLEDGRRLLVDEVVAARLENHDVVDKPAWSATYRTDRGQLTLPFPTRLARLALAFVLVLALIAVAAFRPALLDRVSRRVNPRRGRSTPVGR